jgi:uncharacterized membrane protein YdjX (TVP38/TMEM64 family)
MTRVFASDAARRSALRRLGLLSVALLASIVAVWQFAPFLFDPAWLRTNVRATVRRYGTLGPLVFVGIQALQVVVAPIPGQVLGLVGGYLFGPVLGTVYSLLGVVVGSAVVLVASRRLGRPYVERVVDPETLDRFDERVRRSGAPLLFVLFLLPTFPDDALCFVAGLSEIRVRTVLVLVLVGRAPSFLAVALAGDQLAASRLWTVLALLGLLSVLSFVVYRKRDRVVAAVDGLGT